MSKNATDPVSREFDLTCTDCSYEQTVAGSFLDALDVADNHGDEHGRTNSDHFVDITKNVL